MSDDEFEGQNKQIIEDFRRRYGNLRERRAALEKNAEKTMANALKKNRQALLRDALAKIKAGESGALTPDQRAMIEAARSGAEIPRLATDEKITGFETMPWENDEY